MAEEIKVLAFTGSLRRGSYNKAALRAAQQLAPEGMNIEIVDLADLPFFNEDLEAEGVPVVVEEFTARIVAADALLICTPEYNFSIPPVLKNALDWASRGNVTSVNGKPAAIMSASTGMVGGARVQYHLRQVCTSLNLLVLNRPEVFITQAQTKFDEAGNLHDERTQQSITRLLKALAEWTVKVR